MKKPFPSAFQRFLLVFLLAAYCSLLTALPAFAAGSVIQTFEGVTVNTSLLTFSWTGDAANGTVPATASTRSIEGFVVLVVTNPGTTAPTDDYDITLTDVDGVDVMGGQLQNRDEANSEHAAPQLQTGIFGERWVSGVLTLNISNQSVAGATGTVKVFIRR